MTKLLFRNRTGQDLFQFMTMALTNEDRAKEWALQNFSYKESSGENLSIQEIAIIKNNKPVLFLQLVNSIFNTDFNSFEVDDNGDKIVFINLESNKLIVIEKKPITNNLIQQIQTEKENKKRKGKEVQLLKNLIHKFFDVDSSVLEEENYEVAYYLLNEVNNFLTTITSTRSEFDIDDELFSSTEGNAIAPMDNLVSSSSGFSNENQQAETKIVG